MFHVCEDSYLTEVLTCADNFVWSVDCQSNRANMSELYTLKNGVTLSIQSYDIVDILAIMVVITWQLNGIVQQSQY